jgi:hypothetical protein
MGHSFASWFAIESVRVDAWVSRLAPRLRIFGFLFVVLARVNWWPDTRLEAEFVRRRLRGGVSEKSRG